MDKQWFRVIIGSRNLKEGSRLVRVSALNHGDAADMANQRVHYGAGNVIESIATETKGGYNGKGL